jgi:hypothetical protein
LDSATIFPAGLGLEFNSPQFVPLPILPPSLAGPADSPATREKQINKYRGSALAIAKADYITLHDPTGEQVQLVELDDRPGK